jgi:hypothetical protein
MVRTRRRKESVLTWLGTRAPPVASEATTAAAGATAQESRSLAASVGVTRSWNRA